MKPTLITFGIILAASVLAACQTKYSGESTRTETLITADESQLVFAPRNAVPMPVKYELSIEQLRARGAAPYSEYSVSGKSKDRISRFYFEYKKLGGAHGPYFFNQRPDLKDYLDRIGSAFSWSISNRDSGSIENQFNAYWEFKTFTTSDRSCVALESTWGDTPSSGHWYGNKRVIGYYCREKEAQFSKSDVSEIGRSIGIRDIWMPANFEQRLAAMDKGSVSRSVTDYSAKEICSFATSGSIGNRQWETHDRWQAHVKEAKGRGFTLDDCVQHAGY